MTVYYVSNHGDDSSQGKSKDAPFKTLKKAFSQLRAGDTLFIRGGTYYPGDEGIATGWEPRIKGTENAPVLVKAYEGEKVVLTGKESGTYNGRPGGPVNEKDIKRSVAFKGTTYHHNQRSLLLLKDCSYLTVEGINFESSLGQFVEVNSSRRFSFKHLWQGAPGAGNNAALSHHIKFKECTFWNSRHRNLRVQDTWWFEVEGCRFSFGSWARRGGGSAMNFINTHYVHVSRCIFDHGCGEIIVFAKPDTDPHNCYIWDCVFMDNEDGVYACGGEKIVIANNFFYRTNQERSAPRPITDGNVSAINIRTAECDSHRIIGIKEVLACGNIIANCDVGVKVRADPEDHKIKSSITEHGKGKCTEGYMPQPIEDLWIVNNTIAGATTVSYHMLALTGRRCVLKNNISINAAAHYSLGFTKDHNYKEWSIARNLYDSGSGTVPSQFRGPGDIYNADPGLSGAKPPDKGSVHQDQARAGYFVNFNLADDYNDASNFRIRPGGDAAGAGESLDPPTWWTSDPYSYCALDFYDRSFDFSLLAGIGPRRSAPWDIGAHGSGDGAVVDRPAAAAAADDTSPRTGQLVSFTGSVSGGAGVNSWRWIMGDGTEYTEQNPTHQFQQAGQYIVKLKVTDSAGISGVDTITMTVTEEVSNTEGGTVGVEVVAFAAGDASFRINGGSPPKAILFTWAGENDASASGAPGANSLLGLGAWSADGGQMCAIVYARNGVNPSLTRSLQLDDAFYVRLDETDWQESNKAFVSSVTAEQVNLRWGSSHNNEKFTATIFWGDSVKTAAVKKFTLGNAGVETQVSGDYNLIFLPSSLDSGFVTRTQRGGMSLGAAVRGQGQHSYAWQNRNKRDSTIILSGTYTDRIGDMPNTDVNATITSWSSQAVGFTPVGNGVNDDVAGLFMKIDGAELAIGQLDMPLDSMARSVELGWKPGYVMLWGGRNPTLNSEFTGEQSEQFTVHHAAGGAVYSLAVSGTFGTGTTQEHSLFDSKLVELNRSTVAGSGTVALDSSGFSINMPDPWNVPRKRLWFAIEDKGTSAAGINAAFSVNLIGSTEEFGGICFAGQQLTLANLSASSGAITLNSWDFGDGTTSSDANPTKTYTRPGTYDITLTVEDDTAQTDSAAYSLVVFAAPPLVTFSPLTDVTPQGGVGNAPLDAMIRFSGFAAGSGGKIARLDWQVMDEIRKPPVDKDGEPIFAFKRSGSSQPGDIAGFTIDVPGEYRLRVSVIYDDGPEAAESQPYSYEYVYQAIFNVLPAAS